MIAVTFFRLGKSVITLLSTVYTHRCSLSILDFRQDWDGLPARGDRFFAIGVANFVVEDVETLKICS